jgi:hypothetical protein
MSRIKSPFPFGSDFNGFQPLSAQGNYFFPDAMSVVGLTFCKPLKSLAKGKGDFSRQKITGKKVPLSFGGDFNGLGGVSGESGTQVMVRFLGGVKGDSVPFSF